MPSGVCYSNRGSQIGDDTGNKAHISWVELAPWVAGRSRARVIVARRMQRRRRWRAGDDRLDQCTSCRVDRVDQRAGSRAGWRGPAAGATQKEPQPVTNAQRDVECPFLDIRQGASTLTFPPPPPDGGNEAMALKYQGMFVRAARDCAVVNGQMVMRVGVQGRIIVGPAGGAGHIEVPVRIAVVSAPLTAPKTVVTKLIRIPVTIGTTDDNVDFTHIEEGLSFPMPTSSSDSYLVYIGFDPLAAAAQDQAKKPAPAKKPKPAVKPNPNAPTG